MNAAPYKPETQAKVSASSFACASGLYSLRTTAGDANHLPGRLGRQPRTRQRRGDWPWPVISRLHLNPFHLSPRPWPGTIRFQVARRQDDEPVAPRLRFLLAPQFQPRTATVSLGDIGHEAQCILSIGSSLRRSIIRQRNIRYRRRRNYSYTSPRCAITNTFTRLAASSTR